MCANSELKLLRWRKEVLQNITSFPPGAVSKGLRRWRELPQAADFASERGLIAPVYDDDDTALKLDDSEFTQAPVMISNLSLIQVVEQWRTEWKLGR